MRIKTAAPIALAFAAGVLAGPWATELLRDAHAQTVPLAPAAIDISALTDADLSATPNPDLRSKTLVVTDQATLAVQTGNVAKHYHAKSDEIQYIVEGTGTAWLGDRLVDLKPGMLLVIPKGTAHAGTVPSSGRFKAIAIKIPPQANGDTVLLE